jgi:hypothetical protein
VLTISVDDLQVIKWHVDASFAVHPDFRSHTGGVMTYGCGAIQTISRKQQLNTRSSTEAELVGADDAATKILWTKLFLERQGYGITSNILFQDNQSAILLETNGQAVPANRPGLLTSGTSFWPIRWPKGMWRSSTSLYRCHVGRLHDQALAGEAFPKVLQGHHGNGAVSA